MKKKVLIGCTVVALAAAAVAFRSAGVSPATKTTGSSSSTSLQQASWLVAAPGRVEPSSEDIKLGAEISGKLKTVLVEEGDSIRRGQVLAEFENSDYRAQVESAQAEVKQKEAELRKVINGARSQERREALSSVHEAEAVMKNAEAEMLRRQKLYAAGVISREEADRYAKEYDVAKARYDEKVQSHALIDQDAREEDRSMAEANLASAIAQLDAAKALLAKSYVRAPIDGTVLRKHHRAGESVSNGSNTPDPIFTIGDKRALRVRMDVDEADVSKLTLGQSAYVTADTYGDKKFWGHIVRIGQELGRKNVRTDEPTERVDTKILETLVQLDEGVELPVGLRVDAFIVGGRESK
jgi:ABC exporter DevB family membrane fusion protein